MFNNLQRLPVSMVFPHPKAIFWTEPPTNFAVFRRDDVTVFVYIDTGERLCIEW